VTITPAGRQAGEPSIACVYDYLLGGAHNFAADQEAARQFLARWPDAPVTMRANRAFLGRVVRYLAGQAGVRQFLDIGSGIPTMGNVHEIAQQVAQEARVVYVDNDAVAVQHSRSRSRPTCAGHGRSWATRNCGTCWTCPSRSRC